MGQPPELIKPAYGAGCISDLVPYLLEAHGAGALPIDVNPDAPVVLLVLDGLGYEQLLERAEIAPYMNGLDGGHITSVAPSTTSCALTSITTGLTPGEHGLVGYRFVVDGYLLNALRWADPTGRDLRSVVPPHVVQPFEPFMGQRISYVARAEFAGSGFTEAGWRGSDLVGYRTLGTLIHHVGDLISSGKQFVYAYYEGIDKVSHEYGLGDCFDAEIAATDEFVAQLVGSLPSGTQVVVTADHGQVDCAGGLTQIGDEVMTHVDSLSGEGRFRWLHAKDGAAPALLDIAGEVHGNTSWVKSKAEIIEEKWLGPTVSEEAIARLGDVALVPFEPIAFDDPQDTGIFDLIGRHGSLTSAEMLVPCLVATA